MVMKRFHVVKRFLGGNLHDVAISVSSPVPFEVGRIYKCAGHSGKFVVLACEEVA